MHMLGKHPVKLIVAAILIIAVTYLYFPGFSIAPPESPQEEIRLESYGVAAGSDLNIVSIAPVMKTTDYASAHHFKVKMTAYLEAANQEGWLTPKTIVLLPEHIGTPLLMSGYKSRVYNADSIKSAALPIIARDLPDFIKNYYIFNADDPVLAAAVRTKTKEAASIYHAVFSSLAQQYNVTIVAGSILLMTPGIYPDGLSYGHGPIFNAGFVFGPDGKPQIDAIRQVNPAPAISGIAKASKAEFLPVFTLHGQRIAVVIGNDVYNEDVQAYLGSQTINIVLSPQFLPSGNHDFGSLTTDDDNPAYNWFFAASMGSSGWDIDAGTHTSFRGISDGTGSGTFGERLALIDNVWIPKSPEQ